jgi:hypothetical protein
MTKQKKSSATIVTHCAVFGTNRKDVREFHVRPPQPYAQYPVSVSISFVEPGKRTTYSYRVVPDNLAYRTIEQNGVVVYDSRNDVPCDMAKWRETYAKHRAEWLERQAEIDRENAESASKGWGWRTQQMGDFRFDELANQ